MIAAARREVEVVEEAREVIEELIAVSSRLAADVLNPFTEEVGVDGVESEEVA